VQVLFDLAVNFAVNIHKALGYRRGFADLCRNKQRHAELRQSSARYTMALAMSRLNQVVSGGGGALSFIRCMKC
jgi:hypothetical protein